MALGLVAAVVRGLGGSDRGVAAIHTDALKAVDKRLKDRSASTPIKTAAAAVIKAVAEAGGAGLWANAGSVFDDTARVCVLGLADPSLTVREAFAAALGEVAALGETADASNVPSAKEAVRHLTLTCLRAQHEQSEPGDACDQQHTVALIAPSQIINNAKQPTWKHYFRMWCGVA